MIISSFPFEVTETILKALKEDIGSGDATSQSIIPPDAWMNGVIMAKQDGIVAGLDIARLVLRLVDERIEMDQRVKDGERVTHGQKLAFLHGPAQGLLTAERTALNFLGRMSGIATLTGRFMQAVAGTKTVILDTRKTAPGLRYFDKLAVKLGGGQNHRTGLYDMILIKDNHIDFAGSITEAVTRARSAHTSLAIEVEARTLEDVQTALDLKVDRIMLDNMNLDAMRQACKLVDGRIPLEASGNITLETAKEVAETGVDYISTGSLTHSVPVFDMSLKWTRND